MRDKIVVASEYTSSACVAKKVADGDCQAMVQHRDDETAHAALMANGELDAIFSGLGLGLCDDPLKVSAHGRIEQLRTWQKGVASARVLFASPFVHISSKEKFSRNRVFL